MIFSSFKHHLLRKICKICLSCPSVSPLRPDIYLVMWIQCNENEKVHHLPLNLSIYKEIFLCIYIHASSICVNEKGQHCLSHTSANSLFEPLLTLYQSHPQEPTSAIVLWKYVLFFCKKMQWKMMFAKWQQPLCFGLYVLQSWLFFFQGMWVYGSIDLLVKVKRLQLRREAKNKQLEQTSAETADSQSEKTEATADSQSEKAERNADSQSEQMSSENTDSQSEEREAKAGSQTEKTEGEVDSQSEQTISDSEGKKDKWKLFIVLLMRIWGLKFHWLVQNGTQCITLFVMGKCTNDFVYLVISVLGSQLNSVLKCLILSQDVNQRWIGNFTLVVIGGAYILVPCYVVKSLHLIWILSTPTGILLVHDLQMTCNGLN